MQQLFGFTGVRGMDVLHFVETKEMIKKAFLCELFMIPHNEPDHLRPTRKDQVRI